MTYGGGVYVDAPHRAACACGPCAGHDPGVLNFFLNERLPQTKRRFMDRWGHVGAWGKLGSVGSRHMLWTYNQVVGLNCRERIDDPRFVCAGFSGLRPGGTLISWRTYVHQEQHTLYSLWCTTETWLQAFLRIRTVGGCPLYDAQPARHRRVLPPPLRRCCGPCRWAYFQRCRLAGVAPPPRWPTVYSLGGKDP